ncbi:MAG: hypothetical protein L6437_00155 [Kiritimatiellae bacterium]|nr:hypothetical protein [Kiritimatiellia bacterium]
MQTMKWRWALVVLASLFMITNNAWSVEASTIKENKLSVGFVDPYGGWYVKSTFLLLQNEFLGEGVQVGYILPVRDNENAFWEQIRQFQVLMFPGFSSEVTTNASLQRVLKRYTDAGGGVFIV